MSGYENRVAWERWLSCQCNISYSHIKFNNNKSTILQEYIQKGYYLTQWASSTTNPDSCPCNLSLLLISTVTIDWCWETPRIYYTELKLRLTFRCRHFRISWNNAFPAILSGVTYKSLHEGSSFLKTPKGIVSIHLISEATIT